jgi:hypothetical protein
MVRRQARQKRFTITLDDTAYRRLAAIAKGHSPPLSLTYVMQYAAQLLLERAEDPQFVFEFRDPTRRKKSHGQD